MPIPYGLVLYRSENIDLQVFPGMNVELIAKGVPSSRFSDSVQCVTVQAEKAIENRNS